MRAHPARVIAVLIPIAVIASACAGAQTREAAAPNESAAASAPASDSTASPSPAAPLASSAASESAADASASPDVAATRSAESQRLVGEVLKLQGVLPLDGTAGVRVVNKLPFPITIAGVDQVDSHDWLTDGRPDRQSPGGFLGARIAPGAGETRTLMAKPMIRNAPFRLSFTASAGASGGGEVPLTSLSFNKSYMCAAKMGYFPIYQTRCIELVTSKDWAGFSLRSSDNYAVANQFPNYCDTKTAPFTYSVNGVQGKAEGILRCQLAINEIELRPVS